MGGGGALARGRVWAALRAQLALVDARALFARSRKVELPKKMFFNYENEGRRVAWGGLICYRASQAAGGLVQEGRNGAVAGAALCVGGSRALVAVDVAFLALFVDELWVVVEGANVNALHGGSGEVSRAADAPV